MYDLARDVLTQVTFEGDNAAARWTRDGRQITVASSRYEPSYPHYNISPDGSGGWERISEEQEPSCCSLAAWSPDGAMVYSKMTPTGSDMWFLSAPDISPAPLIEMQGSQRRPAFSPDGRFIAYESDESGTNEIILRGFPNVDDGQRRVSDAGGKWPVWGPNGQEILYVSSDGIMRVAVRDIETSSLPSLGRPVLVFEVSGLEWFGLSPDGQTFALSRVPVESSATEINIVLNWFEELKERVPVP